ncbi:hypothetical protein MNAN1_000465 [Malassezia nana]|uniref:Uncharacterized protein n=1 Tax=Malassezia nana TaxID=180528 RepID=A0AAF0EJ17_9BASI|nr:hypothetical protein MNAN1_000465 [Malassezia nana]
MSLRSPVSRIVSQSEILKEAEAYEAKVKKGEAELASMGFQPLSILRQEVTWAEQDQYRHVNNVYYLRWFESARMRWITRMARTLDPKLREGLLKGNGIGTIVASTLCRYRRPVTYPDTVLIAVGTLPLKHSNRCIVRQKAFSVEQQTVVAEADFDVVGFDFEKQRKADFPAEMVAALEAWQYRGKDAHQSRL